jgi:hypothetical protein
MNIKIQDENIISSDRYLTEKINDLNELIKIKNEEREKIILLSEITKNERRIISSIINTPFKLKDELRKKISLKFHKNENNKINNPINNLKLVNNSKIVNFRAASSVNFDKLSENMKVKNIINYNGIKKSPVPDMKKRINERYGVSPIKKIRNIRIKKGVLSPDRSNYLRIKLKTEGNIKEEEKNIKILNESESKNKIFKLRNLNSEEREKIRKDFEKKLRSQKSQIKKTKEKDNSEEIKKKYLEDLTKKKEKEEK